MQVPGGPQHGRPSFPPPPGPPCAAPDLRALLELRAVQYGEALRRAAAGGDGLKARRCQRGLKVRRRPPPSSSSSSSKLNALKMFSTWGGKLGANPPQKNPITPH